VRRVQRRHDPHRVRRAVEEIGITEGDVLGAGGHLRRHVGEHDLGLDDAELSLVDRHDRTMPAGDDGQAAAGFGVADDSRSPPGICSVAYFDSAGRLAVRSGTRSESAAEYAFLARSCGSFFVVSPAQAASASSNSPPKISSAPSPRSHSALSGA